MSTENMIYSIVAIVFIFGPLIFRLVLIAWEKIAENSPDAGTKKCPKCKGRMTHGEEYLFLIPVMFDKKHEESSAYYVRNFRRINDKSQIPSGQRACRLYVFQCPECGFRNVSIEDFLSVRDNEVINGGGTYPYEDFKDYLL